MTERPILFSAPMVRAILDGRKTQTRRIVKPQPIGVWGASVVRNHTFVGVVDGPHDYCWTCPYGQPGDRLWVREAFAGSIAYERHGYPLKEWGNKLWYLADGEPRSGQWTRPLPSIHMPRCLSRITLEITEVRIERLNDISEADAQAEGCTGSPLGPAADLLLFPTLWESINGPGSWAANPWVWVIGFTRLIAQA